MKIALSSQLIVPGHLTVWQEGGPGIDLAMDLKALTFRENSIEQLITIHALDHMFPEETQGALTNWYKVLKPGGVLFVVVDDFEYIARAVVGADISLDLFNQEHAHPSYFSKESLTKMFCAAGFKEDNMRLWFADVPDLIPKKHYELILAAQK